MKWDGVENPRWTFSEHSGEHALLVGGIPVCIVSGRRGGWFIDIADARHDRNEEHVAKTIVDAWRIVYDRLGTVPRNAMALLKCMEKVGG